MVSGDCRQVHTVRRWVWLPCLQLLPAGVKLCSRHLNFCCHLTDCLQHCAATALMASSADVMRSRGGRDPRRQVAGVHALISYQHLRRAAAAQGRGPACLAVNPAHSTRGMSLAYARTCMYPSHCAQVSDKKHISQLLCTGRMTRSTPASCQRATQQSTAACRSPPEQEVTGHDGSTYR